MGMNDDDARVHDALRKLESDLKSIKPSRVLLVGDILMDCYIHGFANNLNSRAPVPILKEISRDEDLVANAPELLFTPLGPRKALNPLSLAQ